MVKALVQAAIGWERKDRRERNIIRFRLKHWLANILCLFPFPLTFWLNYFRSDKHMPGLHQYGRLYAELFRPFRYRPIKFLEIGIGGYREDIGGRSLLAWQAYFPFATIVACDIEPREFLSSARTRIFQLDQSSRAALTALREKEGPFDIILDDGSHQSTHQLLTFAELFEAVRPGGLYIIEDVGTSYLDREVGGIMWDGKHPADPRFRETCMGQFLEVAKLLNRPKIYDLTGVDPVLLDAARKVRRVTFEKDLIVVHKADGRPTD
jgi:hypothetical protein